MRRIFSVRSPLDYMLQRVGGMKISEVARRCVPCYKHVIEPDGARHLALCLLVDHNRLYRFPYEDDRSKIGIAPRAMGMRGLELKVRYIRGDMEHLRLREFQPGLCRYVKPQAA
jgi:hypothetical protein